MTKNYCCFGAFYEVGHDQDCKGPPMNATTNAAELPALPEAFAIWKETDEDCGAWGRPDQPVFTADQMRAFASAALSAQSQQEPVAYAVYWGVEEKRRNSVHFERKTAEEVAAEIKSVTEIRPLYTAPQAAQPAVAASTAVEPGALSGDLMEVIEWADKLGAIGHPNRAATAIRELSAKRPQAPDGAAQSIASMVTEWVDGGIRMGTDWRSGLADVIANRLTRFQAALPAAPGKETPVPVSDVPVQPL